ncbi:MAG: hypothetical protein ABIL58_14750 [Pseudomonadota bacterium]
MATAQALFSITTKFTKHRILFHNLMLFFVIHDIYAAGGEPFNGARNANTCFPSERIPVLP